MIDEDKIKKALETEVKDGKLPTNIWQGVNEKIMVKKKSNKTPLRWPNSPLIASILVVFLLVSFGGGISIAFKKHVPRPDTVLNFEANLNGNKVSIKGEAPIPDEAKIRFTAHREIAYEEKKQKEVGNVLIGLADSEVLDGHFVATLILDDSEWFNRQLARNNELDSEQKLDIEDNVIITGLYIPEELQPSPDNERKQRSFTFSFSTKNSDEEGESKSQVLPRRGQVEIYFPFNIK